MSQERKFARFVSCSKQLGPAESHVPDAGMCISSFLVIKKKSERTKVLMGKINEKEDLEYKMGLNRERASMFKDGWLLPSSHLVLFEGVADSARRILNEQIGLKELKLEGPTVVSEAYKSSRIQSSSLHWDFEFIFIGELENEPASYPNIWKELRFVDLAKIKRSEIARSHDDVIEYSGVYKW